MMRGLRMNLGPSVGIKVGEVDVVITSRPQQTFDAEIFTLHGIDPTRCSVIGLKSAIHFRACFRDLAAEILTADSPGLTMIDVCQFDHLTHPGKLWPVDINTQWQPN
jgi:microcystin degradation protein MlrC